MKDAKGYLLAKNLPINQDEKIELIKQPEETKFFKPNSTRMIYVRSNFLPFADGSFKLAVFEKNTSHKGGELFVADSKAHLVVLTNGVCEALNSGKLIEVAENDLRTEKNSDAEYKIPNGNTFIDAFEAAWANRL